MAVPSEPNEFHDALLGMLKHWKLDVLPDQLARLHVHFAAVIEANQVMNLTRITDPLEAAIKHYADSLFVLAWARDQEVDVETVLDVGTGAGFPAVPLAIMRPDWRVTAIDATNKKVDFVARIATALGLKNLSAEHAHSDHWQPRRTFDLVLSRALGPLEKCLHAGAKFVAPRGRLIAYKTRAQADAGQDSIHALLRSLHLRHEGSYGYQLFVGDEALERALMAYGGATR